MAPTITVYRGFPITATHVWSPFTVKLEAHLRFAGVSYTVDKGSPRSSPRGKIPYIGFKLSKDVGTELYSDTQLISDLLKEHGILPDMNETLSPAEKAIDLAVTALLEDKLYFYNAAERWIDNFYTMRDGIFASMPYPLRVVIGYIAWRRCKTILYGQGTGRFSTDEINSFREKVWSNLNNLLADARQKTASSQSPFWALGGQGPTEADTALFGFIIAGLVCDASPVSAKLIRRSPNVVEFARRIHETYFPDYEAPKWE